MDKINSTSQMEKARRLSIAPMLDHTDRHFRFFLRLLSRRVLLYTEMVTTGAVLHGNRQRLLDFDAAEHPVACQLGGAEPKDLAEAARIIEDFGYDEVNLNVGCPSDRVQSGRFGACLMAEPERVAACVAAMREAVKIPVTVKHRIGIDNRDSYEFLVEFVRMAAAAGCHHFIVHARKAYLRGLSPKENRTVPPLRHEVVYQLKQDFPHLHVTLNGGIESLAEVGALRHHVDGVMLGRAVLNNPWLLQMADQQIFGDTTPPSVRTRFEAIETFLPYVQAQRAVGVRLHHITRHLIQLFSGCAGARDFRRYLSEHAWRPGADETVLVNAAETVRQRTRSM